MKYIPRFYNNEEDVLILDTVFNSDECIDYAKTHNMNVRYEDTTSTNSIRVVMNFINNGFKPEFIEEEQIYQGLNLGNKVVVNFKMRV